jgi:hypothetical protein
MANKKTTMEYLPAKYRLKTPVTRNSNTKKKRDSNPTKNERIS